MKYFHYAFAAFFVILMGTAIYKQTNHSFLLACAAFGIIMGRLYEIEQKIK